MATRRWWRRGTSKTRALYLNEKTEDRRFLARMLPLRSFWLNARSNVKT